MATTEDGKQNDNVQPLMKSDGKDGAAYLKDVEKVEVRQPASEEFVGLTKDELERYANDPFWKTLRLILFILFWLAWIAMFVAAIAIVIMAPKCPEKPIRHWWQKKVCYQIYTKAFMDSDGNGVGDLKGIESKLGDLSKMKVQTVWPADVIRSDEDDFSAYAPVDHKHVDDRIGTLQDFESLVKGVHGKDMFFVMDFVPSVTSDQFYLFGDSRRKEKPESDDFYYWADAVPAGGDNPLTWTKDTAKGKFYRHWPDKPQRPILNLQNDHVFGVIEDALKFWLSKGVDGFYVFTRFLALSEDGKEDWPAAVAVMKKLREAVDTHKNETGSDKEILLFTSLSTKIDGLDEAKKDELEQEMVYDGEVNFVINGDVADISALDAGAGKIHDALDKQLKFHKDYNDTWPMWEVGNPTVSRVSTRFGSRERGELAMMLLLVLPGSMNNYYGDEIGMVDAVVEGDKAKYAMRSPMQWDDSPTAGWRTAEAAKEPGAYDIPIGYNSTIYNFETQYDTSTSGLRMFKRLADIRRKDETFLFGNFGLGPRNDTVFTFYRQAETRGLNYVAALNFGNDPVKVNLMTPPLNCTETASVVEMTTNLDERGVFGIRKKIDITELELHGNEGIVVKYKT